MNQIKATLVFISVVTLRIEIDWGKGIDVIYCQRKFLVDRPVCAHAWAGDMRRRTCGRLSRNVTALVRKNMEHVKTFRNKCITL